MCMKEIVLTQEQKNGLERLHANTRDKCVCDRIKAVLLRSEGWSTQMIAQALRLHETTIIRHLDDFLENNKLKPENGGSQSYLTEEQSADVIAHLEENTYQDQVKIIEFIWGRHRIKFSVPGLNKWLDRNGFSYKKAKGVPHRFDATKQAAFIAEYHTLKDQLTDEPILFIDAAHPTQATKLSSGWIRTGTDKPIKTSGSRTRINLVGAIDLNDIGSALVNRYENVNSDTMQDFITESRQQYPANKTVHIILDGAGYHKAKTFVDLAKKLNIQLHYLPPYSPNLNPIERLWKVMNEHVRNNKYFSSAKEFRQRIDDFFHTTLPQIGSQLKNRINDNFQVLNPAS